jgi:hypothetical protein
MYFYCVSMSIMNEVCEEASSFLPFRPLKTHHESLLFVWIVFKFVLLIARTFLTLLKSSKYQRPTTILFDILFAYPEIVNSLYKTNLLTLYSNSLTRLLIMNRIERHSAIMTLLFHEIFCSSLIWRSWLAFKSKWVLSMSVIDENVVL